MTGLFNAIASSVTALSAQSTLVNAISSNVANVSTTGYKVTQVSFQNLVTGQVGGGVLSAIRTDVSGQGGIESTNVGTDLGIQGNGFFVVKDLADNVFYTRAGSFRTDSAGNLVNEAGYILQGWPLDSEGRLPGESGNTTNLTSNQDLSSLVNISTSSITGTASPTTAITANVNLKAEQDIIRGAGATLAFPSSSVNSGITSTQTIVPTGAMAIGDVLTITPGGTSALSGTAAVTVDYTYGGFEASDNISSTIGGVTDVSTTFTGFTAGDNFTIDTSATGFSAATFTFQANPDPDNNEFSTFTELAQVINAYEGLNARISGGILYIAPDDANDSLTFTDNTGTIAADAGLDDTLSGSGDRFASMQNLADLINAESAGDFAATVTNPTVASSLFIYNVDPTDGITFTDDLASDDLLNEFGFSDAEILAGDNDIDAVYNPSATGTFKSLASGNISSAFSRTITVFTSLGESLDLRLAVAKVRDEQGGQNWAVELFATDSADIETSNPDGKLLASGFVNFNGDGSLGSISAELSNPITIQPAGGAISQEITLNLGNPGEVGVGDTSGLSQFAGQYSVDELSQNGFPTGRLQDLQIDATGTVTAIFDNSLTSDVYKLPLSYFSNPNGLTPESGNAYSVNSNAGEVSLGEVGDASVGTIVPGALEVSTADISTELTDMVIAQQAYSAAANLLRKISEILQELQQL